MTVATSLCYKDNRTCWKLGRLSFFVIISKTGNDGNDKHSDLDKIVPCYIFHNTTFLRAEEGKKMTPSE